MHILQFDTLNCKNCYKCVRHCPVKSIEVKNHCAQIIEEECILCGECTIVCPQRTKDAVSEVDALKRAISEGRRVIASVAPSFFAYFPCGVAALRTAAGRLGFAGVRETAEGAYLVKTAYEKLVADHPDRTFISSCCSSVNLLIARHYPTALPHLAPVATPIQAHAALIKEEEPDALVAFISPCVSKKMERAEEGSAIDFVISFEEFASMLMEAEIALGADQADDGSRLSRRFPVAGGILDTMTKIPGHDYVHISGPALCAQAIRDVLAGTLGSCFLELSLCEGSCVGGPSFRKKQLSVPSGTVRVKRRARADDHAEDFNLSTSAPLDRAFSPANLPTRARPAEEQIQKVLARMGKRSPADELNCGMCGYSSCREKAVAVLAGKAEVTMCLPFMNERAESFSNQIINLTPNIIVCVDADMKVQQINHTACQLFRLQPDDILRQPVSRILDEFPFVDIIANQRDRMETTAFLPEYNLYLSQTFVYDRENGIIVGIMKNISEERRRRSQQRQKKVQAAAMADDIAEKQLRIVHEIASLLGETAAETQAAVHDLKETIMLDGEE